MRKCIHPTLPTIQQHPIGAPPCKLQNRDKINHYLYSKLLSLVILRINPIISPNPPGEIRAELFGLACATEKRLAAPPPLAPPPQSLTQFHPRSG